MIKISASIDLQLSAVEGILSQLFHTFETFASLVSYLLHRIFETDREIYRALQQLQLTISRAPAISIHDCFRFTDAFGQTLDLPYHLFQHWQLFESLLHIRFKERTGEQRVRRGLYNILNAKSTNCVINRESWESSIFPGTEVYMSMIFSAQVKTNELCSVQESLRKTHECEFSGFSSPLLW